ncbi:MAG: HU family DNA-binding protein [Deltaproteobacteria bacterium]
MALTKEALSKSVMETVLLKKPKKDKQQLLFAEFGYTQMTKKRATELVDATLEIIKKALEKGDQVLISGFGKFKVKFKWARKGRNPKTGERIVLDSRRIVNFQCSVKLRDKLRKDSEVPKKK